MEKFYTQVNDRHSEKIQQIIGSPPIWIHRWGISLIFALLIAMIWLLKMISYPEIIKGKLTFHSLSPSNPIFTQLDGEIIMLLAADGEFVEKDQKLAIINTAKGNSTISAIKSGKLKYNGIIYVSQQIAANQKLFSIMHNEINYFGQIKIPLSYVNKINRGQSVIVNVPYRTVHRHQRLNGVIDYIGTALDEQDYRIVKVDFDEMDLIDRTQHEDIYDNMSIDAEILVENGNLLDRVLNNLFNNFRLSEETQKMHNDFLK